MSKSDLEREWVRRESARANNERASRQLLRCRPLRIGLLKIIPKHHDIKHKHRAGGLVVNAYNIIMCCVTTVGTLNKRGYNILL